MADKVTIHIAITVCIISTRTPDDLKLLLSFVSIKR